MTQTQFLLFSVTSVAVIATPGPTMLLALSNGATSGMRIAFFGILGAVLSDLLLIGVVALGLGTVLYASETLFTVVKWAGVAYLLWIARQLWKSRPKAMGLAGGQPVSALRAFLRSLMVALSNPKGLPFMVAFLPQFVNPAGPQLPQYAQLAAMFAGINLMLMTSYALGGTQVTRWLTERGLRTLNKSCAGIMMLLAGALLTVHRSSL